MTAPRASCVVPTWNRPGLAARLLGCLEAQTLPREEFEAVVVDDGSRPPAAPALRALALPFRCQVIEQENAGPGAARHAGALRARGEVLVFVDDDMIVGPSFLEEHLRRHDGRRLAVLGSIERDPRLPKAPLFERYRHRVIDQHHARAAAGARLCGTNLCSANVSVRRADYLAVGGFDPSLRVSEDAELGVRLEAAGVELVFGDSARALHDGDHQDGHWHETAHRYPQFDLAVASKHPGLAQADPWRYLFSLGAPARAVIVTSLLFPRAARSGAKALGKAAEWIDGAGLEGPALRLVAGAFAMEYCSGMRSALGSLPETLRSFLAYRRKLEAR